MSPCMVDVMNTTLFSMLLYKDLPFRSQKFPAYAPPFGVTRASTGGLQSRSGRTGRESELSRLGRYKYLTPGVHLLQFCDSISARYKTRVGRIR